jgi:hypothetical protein
MIRGTPVSRSDQPWKFANQPPDLSREIEAGKSDELQLE